MRPQSDVVFLCQSARHNSPSPVESRILILRHQRVILDSDLAELYGVPVKRLNQQVKRNRERFPADFMFQLTAKEDQIFEVTNCDLKERPRRPPLPALRLHRARRNHGRDRAQLQASHRDECFRGARICAHAGNAGQEPPTRRQDKRMDHRLETHDSAIQDLMEAIKELMVPEETPRRKIGFLLPPAKS